MKKELVNYRCGDKECKGEIYYDPSSQEKMPAIILAHAWRGLDDYARQMAKNVAELGYLAFAADLYGDGKTADNDQEAGALMAPLFIDRKLLRERMQAAYDTAKNHPLVDKDRIGAIGFCFGGLTVIEFYKSGAPVQGVVSFHGILGDKKSSLQAKVEPISQNIKGSILVLHGNDDPFVNQGEIDKFKTDMTQAKADWQFHIFGHAVHAFTNQNAHNAEAGMVYNEITSRRAWQLMANFFEEIFSR